MRNNISVTWELLVAQAGLLTLLVLVSLVLAVCCKKRWLTPPPSPPQDKTTNKHSSDLPPSYSTMDLFTMGMTVDDYLHPPPQYLDLETGSPHHQRLVRLASCGSCSGESLIVLQGNTGGSVATSSRRGSRSSRLSFADVNFSPASLSRLPSQTILNLIHSPASRQSSLVSEGSRRSSLSLKSGRSLISSRSMDEELQAKLAAIVDTDKPARVCDIILEEK